jgi:hypothetical protein
MDFFGIGHGGFGQSSSPPGFQRLHSRGRSLRGGVEQCDGSWLLTPLYNTSANQNTRFYDCQGGRTDFIVTPQFAADPNVVYSGIRIPNSTFGEITR